VKRSIEIKTSLTIRPITPLRRLLAEYHETCEKILDEQEIEVGLWAYKKRTQGDGQRPSSSGRNWKAEGVGFGRRPIC